MSQIVSVVLVSLGLFFSGLSAWAANGDGEAKPATAAAAPAAGTKRTFLGFRLLQVDAGSVYEKAGLRVGDLVRSLNGTPVVQPDDLKQLPVILERDKVVVVKIERAGKKITLRYRRFKKR